MRFVGSIPRLDDTVILLSKGITTTRVEVIYNMCGHYRGKHNYGTITYGDCIETRYYYYRYYPYGSTDSTFCLYRYRYSCQYKCTVVHGRLYARLAKQAIGRYGDY